MGYIERNPVRAGLCDDPSEYPWSSAAVHCGYSRIDGLLQLGPWREAYGAERWREVLRCGIQDEAPAERSRLATRCGRPLGSEAFVEQLEMLAGRLLRPRAPGRPNKRQRSMAGCVKKAQMALEIGV